MTAAYAPSTPQCPPAFAGPGTPAQYIAAFCLRHSSALTILATLAIVFARRPDSLLTPQFFWEDGVIFFKDSLLEGFALFNTYAGYVHLIPRAAAKFFMALPYAWQPLFYNLTAYGCTAFVSACILSPRLELPYKPLLALAVVLPPHDSVVYANLTHIQFNVTLLLPVLTLYKAPENYRQSLFDVCTLLVVGLTGPFVVFFAPFALCRLLHGPRDRHTLLFLAAYCVPLAIQGFFLGRLTFYTIEHLAPRPDPDVWYDALARGASAAYLVFRKWKISGIVLSLLLYVFVAYAALSLPDPKHRRVALISLGLGFLIMAGGYFKYRDDPMLMLRLHERYFFVQRVFLLWALILAMATHRAPLRQIATVCLFLLFGVAIYHSCFAHPRVFFDNNWAYHAKKIDFGIPVFLPIAPNNMIGILLPERTNVAPTVTQGAIPADAWESDGCWKSNAVLPPSPDPTREYFFGTRAGGCLGEIHSKPFTVDRPMLLEIPLIHGKKNPKDMRLGVRSLNEPQREKLCDLGAPSSFWTYCGLDLAAFRGQPVVVFAEDRSSELESWLGFGQPWLYAPNP